MHLDGTLPKNAKIKTFHSDEIFKKLVHDFGFFVNGILRWR